MEYSINLYFPFNGHTDNITVSENVSLDDIHEYIFATYNFDNFDIVSNDIKITKINFHLVNDMKLSIIPSMKSGRNNISRKINPNIIKKVKILYVFQNHENDIPNQRLHTTSSEVSQKYVHDFDRDELENLGKKYKIAMEREFQKEQERNKENQKIHEKIMNLREKIHKSKTKYKNHLNGIIEEPKKPEKYNYCGFKKGFLL